MPRNCVHKEPFTPEISLKQKPIMLKNLYRRSLLHPNNITPNNFFTNELYSRNRVQPEASYDNIFAPNNFDTKELHTRHCFHQNAFTPETFLHLSSTPEAFYILLVQLSTRQAVTPEILYTQKILTTKPFATTGTFHQRAFTPQDSRTKKALALGYYFYSRNMFTRGAPKNLNTKEFPHAKVYLQQGHFTPKNFYTRTPSTPKQACTSYTRRFYSRLLLQKPFSPPSYYTMGILRARAFHQKTFGCKARP